MAQVPPITAANRWLTSASSVISFAFPSADPDPFRADLARRRLRDAGHRSRPEAGVEPEGVDLGNHGVSPWCDAAVKGYRHP
jgi:hypothetical protein